MTLESLDHIHQSINDATNRPDYSQISQLLDIAPLQIHVFVV